MVDIDGVSETALMTLYNRGTEARRPDALINDPLAAELLAGIDYPFADRFGRPDLSHVLRAIQFDQRVRTFLREHPAGTVVALGEGLETEFWRVDNGTVRWCTVDLPAITDLRRRLLPVVDRNEVIPGSAFDPEWMDAVGAPDAVLILAQGLFMYFPEDAVRTLVGTLAQRFSGAELVFDTIPSWAATDSGHRQSRAYRMPPQPWGIGRSGLRALAGWPGVREVHVLDAPRGRGVGWGVLYPFLARTPGLRGLVPMTLATSLG